MALIDPNQQKTFERNPEEGNIPTGLYLCELTEVREIGPSAKFPKGNPRLVFEFTICDPNHSALKGKKPVVFLGKTLLKSKEGRESNLVKWARMMGVPNPELGFDPDTLLHKRFNVMVEYTAGTGGEPGRGWARSAMLAPSAQQTAGAASAPPTGAPHASNPNARWDYSDGTTVVTNKTSAEVQWFLDSSGVAPTAIRVKPAGSSNTAAKTALEWGFTAVATDPILF